MTEKDLSKLEFDKNYYCENCNSYFNRKVDLDIDYACPFCYSDDSHLIPNNSKIAKIQNKQISNILKSLSKTKLYNNPKLEFRHYISLLMLLSVLILITYIVIRGIIK